LLQLSNIPFPLCLFAMALSNGKHLIVQTDICDQTDQFKIGLSGPPNLEGSGAGTTQIEMPAISPVDLVIELRNKNSQLSASNRDLQAELEEKTKRLRILHYYMGFYIVAITNLLIVLLLGICTSFQTPANSPNWLEQNFDQKVAPICGGINNLVSLLIVGWALLKHQATKETHGALRNMDRIYIWCWLHFVVICASICLCIYVQLYFSSLAGSNDNNGRWANMGSYGADWFAMVMSFNITGFLDEMLMKAKCLTKIQDDHINNESNRIGQTA